jgi:hypothetical protein
VSILVSQNFWNGLYVQCSGVEEDSGTAVVEVAKSSTSNPLFPATKFREEPIQINPCDESVSLLIFLRFFDVSMSNWSRSSAGRIYNAVLRAD